MTTEGRCLPIDVGVVAPAPYSALRTSRRIPALAVAGGMVAIVAVALALRVYLLPSQGYMYWDEGHYSLEGQFLTDTWQRLLGIHPDPDWPPWGRPPVLLKPTHSFLLSLGMLVAGFSPVATLAVSALLGVLTVVVVFLLGRSLYSTGTGLLAALFLAVLPIHVSYSRQALSEANTALFFSLSVLLYWAGRSAGWPPRWGLAAAGVLLGVTVTTNYRLYVMLLVFLVVELALWVVERRQSRTIFFRRSILLTYATLLPVAAWVALFHWLRGFHEATGLPIWEEIIPYESQIKGFLLMMNAFSRPLVGNLDLAYYPFVLWTFVGPAMLLATGLCLALFLRDRDGLPQKLLLGAWLVVPLLFYTLVTDKAPRCLAIALPAIALLAARGVLLVGCRPWGGSPPWRRVARVGATCLAAAAILAGAADSWSVASQQGGYWPATAYLVEQRIPSVAAGQAPSVYFYRAGTLRVSSVPSDPAALREVYRQGFRHLLIDDQTYLSPASRALMADIERRLRPLASFPDTLKQGPLFFLEHSEWMQVDLRTTLALYEEIRAMRGPSEVRLYDLDQYFLGDGR